MRAFRGGAHGWRKDDGLLKLWVAMELCAGGSITDLAKRMRPKPLPEHVLAYALHETCEAMRYLHFNHIIHRDIKGQNILVTDSGAIKLGASRRAMLSD